MKRTILLVPLLALSLVSRAQYNEIHKAGIKTLQVVCGDKWLALPIIKLRSDNPSQNRINISFDDLTHTYHRYTYSITHCEADWSPSEQLFASDYIEGFAEDNTIDDITESINTNVDYTHYAFSIPNEKCRLKLSGNYKVTVADGDTGEEVLTACFMVVDPKAGISMGATTNTDIDTNLALNVVANLQVCIEYSQGFGISDRNVKLTGEACFDVSKNKELPFVVSTKSANLKVLGTRFTFRDYPEDQCVTVKLMRGHVDIASTKTGKHMEMVGNERLTLNKGTGQMTKMKMEDGNRSDSWIHGELFFDEIPLIQIAQTLERTYKVKIKVAQQLRQRAFYGTFRQTTTIEDILSTMAKTQQMRYKRLKSGEYYIY